MAARKPQNWRAVKAKIIVRFGTISKAAAQIGCHPESIRLAAAGRCPRVAQRLEAALR